VRAAIGFFGGVRAFFGGAGFVVATPSAWGWAAVPVLMAAVLFAGAGALAIWGGSELLERFVVHAGEGAWAVASLWLLRIVLWLVGLVVAFVVAASLAQPLSGFALEELARKQEVALGGRTWPSGSFFAGALRSLRVSLTALAVGLPLLAGLSLVTFLVPPAAVVTVPLKFVVTGVLAAYDLLDYPLSVRGLGVRERLAFMRANAAAVLGFGVAAAALLVVPGFGLLLLPFGAAGATRMVVASAGDHLPIRADGASFRLAP